MWCSIKSLCTVVCSLACGLVLTARADAAPAFEDSIAQRTLACTACHGDQGRAGPDGFYPRLAGKPAGYLYNQLLNFRDGRRHYGLMTRLVDPLTDAYLYEIAQHFAALNVPYAAPSPYAQRAAAPVLARAVFIAAGVGAFVPRALNLPGLDAFVGTQMHYHLDDAAALAGQHVVVHGGDEAAVQQAIACASAPEALRPARTTLQHRRDVFDAPPSVLAQLQALREAGRIAVAVGQATGIEEDAGHLRALALLAPDGSSQRLALDVLLVRLGLAARLGPLADWGLALERKQLVVEPATFSTSVPGIYAVGDIASYPGKRKLIVCGFHEATLAAFACAERLAQHKVPLEYTTSSTRLQQRLGVAPAP